MTKPVRIALLLPGITLLAAVTAWISRPERELPHMVRIPAGTFQMGCRDCGMEDALPVHSVQVDEFWISATPITNAEFARFVRATGYRTVAERRPDSSNYPGVPASALVPGSAVFTPLAHSVPLDDATRWWTYVPGADWRHPEGPSSDIRNRLDHPVVQVAYEDAEAYARWVGARLPSEAEFEFAARGGLEGKKYSWGDEFAPGGRYMANIFEGRFPFFNSGADGFRGTSPVRAFPANGYGLYDLAGNVWQWTSDWYRPDTYRLNAGALVHNPKGPPSSFDPQQPGALVKVERGGSFLCSEEYCRRYFVGSRGKGVVDSASSNLSFRIVRSTPFAEPCLPSTSAGTR